MKKFYLYIFLLLALPDGLFSQVTVGSGGTYSTLSEAFTAVNEGDLTGDVVLQIISSITETSTAIIYQNGYNGTADYTSVTIYPDASGYTIDGDFDGPLIDLNGASNITIDGRVGGTSPDTKDLKIINLSTGQFASTIQFSESANTNTVKYCILKGSGTGATSSGIILFSTASTGSGNDGNTIDKNDITNYYNGITVTRPVNAVFSSGSLGSENSGNTISDNNIFDFFKHGTASNGIFFSLNTTSCTISGNSFYETAPFASLAAVAFNIIKIDNTSGTGFTVSGNFLGGRSASCGGLAWTKSGAFNNAFIAISLNVGTGTASNIQNNTIKNFDWSNLNGSTWTGINISAGLVNIGTTTSNTIGASTGTGSILVSGSGPASSIVNGINMAGSGTVDCQNNLIGSITVVNSTNAGNFYGIYKSGGSGTTTISNNTIGSTSTSNSINASSPSTGTSQSVYGINNTGTGICTINSNTIANLTNGTTNPNTATTGRINGIASTTGPVTISNNVIHNLTIGNANISNTQTGSICGIALVGNTATKTISGNTIYNLSNTYSSFLGSVIGLFFNGNTGANVVRENFIHSLSVAGGSSAFIYGIRIFSGATTYSNNIISLDGNTSTEIYGIYETGAPGINNNLYFNTVYIGGNVGSGVTKTYALYSAVATNTRNFRNNIFFNARSTTGGSNLHYAIYIVAAGGTLTCDFNDYFVTGTGGTLGFYGGIVSTLPIVAGQDNASLAINPVLLTPGGTSAGDYLPSASSLVAVTGTGITTDYAGATRSVTYPSMGAWEYAVSPSWVWNGSTGNNWGTGTNWNYGTVPVSTNSVIIADVANDPIVNELPATPAECNDLTINTGAVLTIAAGRALVVNGILTNNAGNTGLVIKSDVTGDGTLTNNTASVPATVELFLTGGLVSPGVGRFHYIVPPVTSMTIGIVPTVAEVKTALGITNFNGDLLRYREPFAVATKNAGWQYFHNFPGVPPGFTSLVSDYGYNIYLAGGDDLLKFTGQLNAAEHSFNLSYTPGNAGAGWNLIGNPYPCNYDLNGIAGLGTVVAGISNTVYYNNNGTYGYWNVLTNTGSSGGYTDILPPMTGFYVKVSSGGPATLTLPVASKTGSASDARSAHKGAKAASEKGELYIQKVKLVLSSGSKTDETVALLFDDATVSYNEHYDAYKLFGSSTLPSININTAGTDYFMKAVKGPESEPVILPLKVIVKQAGSQTISITEFENLDGIKVVLKHGSVETLLSKYASYTFTSGAGTYNNFQLIIGETNITTDLEKPIEQKFKTWYSNNYLYINPPSEISSEKCKLIIYDLQGKPVYNDNNIFLTAGQTMQLPVHLTEGVYIIRITDNTLSFVSKIVVI